MEEKNAITQTMPANLIELALKQNAPIEQLEKLLNLQERWESGQAKKTFLSAMSEFQSKCPVLTKSKTVSFGQTKYSYAPLGDISAKIKGALKDCGLSYRWEIKDKDTSIEVTCIVSHLDGHSEQTSMSGQLDKSGSKNEIQQRGSTITYLRRYTLTGALGIATADEDKDGRNSEKIEGLTDALKEEISAFASVEKLMDFAMEHDELHKDEDFRKAIQNKKLKLEKK